MMSKTASILLFRDFHIVHPALLEWWALDHLHETELPTKTWCCFRCGVLSILYFSGILNRAHRHRFWFVETLHPLSTLKLCLGCFNKQFSIACIMFLVVYNLGGFLLVSWTTPSCLSFGFEPSLVFYKSSHQPYQLECMSTVVIVLCLFLLSFLLCSFFFSSCLLLPFQPPTMSGHMCVTLWLYNSKCYITMLLMYLDGKKKKIFFHQPIKKIIITFDDQRTLLTETRFHLSVLYLHLHTKWKPLPSNLLASFNYGAYYCPDETEPQPFRASVRVNILATLETLKYWWALGW